MLSHNSIEVYACEVQQYLKNSLNNAFDKRHVYRQHAH